MAPDSPCRPGRQKRQLLTCSCDRFLLVPPDMFGKVTAKISASLQRVWSKQPAPGRPQSVLQQGMAFPQHLPCRSLGQFKLQLLPQLTSWTAGAGNVERGGGGSQHLGAKIDWTHLRAALAVCLCNDAIPSPLPLEPTCQPHFLQRRCWDIQADSMGVTLQKQLNWRKILWRWSTQTLKFLFWSLLPLLSSTLDFSWDATFEICSLNSAEPASLFTETWGEFL